MPFMEVLVHLFIPRHTNNHRSKVLHVDALLVYILVFAVFNLALRSLHRSMPDVLGYATDIHVEQLLAGTNAKRQASGLAPLTLNSLLSQAAAAKAQDMLTKNYWAHNSPTGATPWDFISGAGYKYVVAGENLAKNFSTSQVVVDAWMASPSHRDNLLKSSYKEVGYAVVNGVLGGEETTLVVQMFGASTSSLALAPPVAKPPVLTENALTIQKANPSVAVAGNAGTMQQTTNKQGIAGAFEGVTIRPLVNIPTLTRNIVFVFAGVLLGVLLVDAWVVRRRRVVRVAGHNLAHFLFLSAIIVAASMVGRGSLL
ncbi:hypothetical protein A2Z00_05815 [Candidatus Gottesmanbacteria bacterium RBG_13_45_10]|uniref:SCP domain-containing protein n=1 Tax=Candidatus Gottesmanbacteria bacterium RBG_13_45_10 TaxID=1798370 RepID=A0A1F5ZJ83_9BACT|nr:MAG: hypothetical protein A2Z00_05815 [Candidatus Gottesmanbacteria bacterium RBG_13_45_10]